MNEIMRVENLFKSYWLGNKEIEVLKNISLKIERGQMISIVGASGAGKSTLLHMMGALDHPTRGEVFFEEKSVFQKSSKGLALFRNQNIGFVFQFHHLLPEFSALENVMMPLLISGGGRKSAQYKAEQKLVELGLSDRLHHRPGELSGGEQQRVAIARALILNPSILLADELTGNLDTQTGEKIIELLFYLNHHYKMTMVIVTHNESLAKRMPIHMRITDGILSRSDFSPLQR